MTLREILASTIRIISQSKSFAHSGDDDEKEMLGKIYDDAELIISRLSHAEESNTSIDILSKCLSGFVRICNRAAWLKREKKRASERYAIIEENARKAMSALKLYMDRGGNHFAHRESAKDDFSLGELRELIVNLIALAQELDPSSLTTRQREESSVFIDVQGFTGLMYDLVQEINRAFDADCYVCTAVLSRKLMEGLVISIIQKRFGETHPEYYMSRDKSRTKNYGLILRTFWERFEKDLKQFSSVLDVNRLEKLRKDSFKLKDTFNVDVHQPGSFTNRESLYEVRQDLLNLVKFLVDLNEKVS